MSITTRSAADKKTSVGSEKPIIGFIGQGWIGKSYATDFEMRGFTTVRYSLEEPYLRNKDKLPTAEIVFIAVPTPTTPEQGFSAAIVEEALSILSPGQIAVIKSTILPGTTKEFQKRHPELIIFYAPEFLSEGTAQHDASHPAMNIVGLPEDTKKHRDAAEKIFKVLPPAPYSSICSSTEAEIIKYSHNASGYVQIILFNLMYDLATNLNCDWSKIHDALKADPYICNRYSQPLHKSGRGAGGGCFIKDFAAIRSLYQKLLPEDKAGLEAFQALESKNIDLLRASGKDLKLLEGVYGSKRVRGS